MIKKSKKTKRTIITLTEEQYFFLKEKVIERQKQNKSASVVSIIRDLVDGYMKTDKKRIKNGK